MVNQQDTRTPIIFVLEKSAVSFSSPLFLFTYFHEHFNFLSLTLREGDCILWFPLPFAREIGARAPENDPLANAPFLTAV